MKEDKYQEFLCNSHTLFMIMKRSGLVFKVENEHPFRLYNDDEKMAFLPPDESIKDGMALAFKRDAFGHPIMEEYRIK